MPKKVPKSENISNYITFLYILLELLLFINSILKNHNWIHVSSQYHLLALERLNINLILKFLFGLPWRMCQLFGKIRSVRILWGRFHLMLSLFFIVVEALVLLLLFLVFNFVPTSFFELGALFSYRLIFFKPVSVKVVLPGLPAPIVSILVVICLRISIITVFSAFVMISWIVVLVFISIALFPLNFISSVSLLCFILSNLFLFSLITLFFIIFFCIWLFWLFLCFWLSVSFFYDSMLFLPLSGLFLLQLWFPLQFFLLYNINQICTFLQFCLVWSQYTEFLNEALYGLVLFSNGLYFSYFKFWR